MTCGITLEYVVYEMFWVRPENTEVFDQNDGTTRQVTLITCSKGDRTTQIVYIAERV